MSETYNYSGGSNVVEGSYFNISEWDIQNDNLQMTNGAVSSPEIGGTLWRITLNGSIVEIRCAEPGADCDLNADIQYGWLGGSCAGQVDPVTWEVIGDCAE